MEKQFYITMKRVSQVADNLKPLDRRLLHLVYRYPYVHTEALRHLLASELGGKPALPLRTASAVNQRMARLRRWNLVVGHRPGRPVGTAQYHYYLDELGASVLATEAGLSRREFAWSKAEVVGRLLAWEHAVEVNDFFITLLQCRIDRNERGLHVWESEDFCWTEFAHDEQRLKIAPDGFGVYADQQFDHYFFLEWDRGYGPASSLRDKAWRYCKFYQGGRYLSHYPTFPNVWIVTRTPQRLRVLLAMIGKLVKEEQAAPTFLLTSVERLDQSGPRGTVWYCPPDNTPRSFANG
jgi:hypothetical protein